jgi:hypothetical protein
VLSGTAAFPNAIFEVELTDGTETDRQILAVEVDPSATTYRSVKADGSGDFLTITAALGFIPSVSSWPYIIEIQDSGTYSENLVLNHAPAGWVMIRSAWDRFPTVQAANPALPVIRFQTTHVELRGLRITGATSSADGILIDPGQHNITVMNCLLENNARAVTAVNATSVNLTNNTVYGQDGIFLAGGPSAVLRNNVIYAMGGFAVQTSVVTGICDTDYNCYWPTTGAIGLLETSPGSTTPYNTLSGWQTAIGNQDTNSLNVDPLFVNAGTGDFHLQSTSPVKDQGSPTTVITFPPPVNDAEKYARGLSAAQTNTAYDMGAFEVK